MENFAQFSKFHNKAKCDGWLTSVKSASRVHSQPGLSESLSQKRKEERNEQTKEGIEKLFQNKVGDNTRNYASFPHLSLSGGS